MTFTLGIEFKLHVFGESHGECIGVVIEGCPPGLLIDINQIQQDLDKRKPGGSPLVSTRSETDKLRILSGIFEERATGGPITLSIENLDVDSSSYAKTKYIPRPGHADFTAAIKYKEFNDHRGSGFFSGRMTAAFVMAGGVAKQLLNNHGIKVFAYVIQIGTTKTKKKITVHDIEENVYENVVRSADIGTISSMESEIVKAKEDGDSVGGIVECRITGIPVGLGEPIFDSVESVLSHSMFSIPGVKGIEFGSEFAGSRRRGSENNDSPIIVDGKIEWSKNDAGGILGGITNGAPVIFRIAFKPTATISKKQSTVDLRKMQETTIEAKGRHDPCIVPRAVPVVEALAAITIVDLLMRNTFISHKGNGGSRSAR